MTKRLFLTLVAGLALLRSLDAQVELTWTQLLPLQSPLLLSTPAAIFVVGSNGLNGVVLQQFTPSGVLAQQTELGIATPTLTAYDPTVDLAYLAGQGVNFPGFTIPFFAVLNPDNQLLGGISTFWWASENLKPYALIAQNGELLTVYTIFNAQDLSTKLAFSVGQASISGGQDVRVQLLPDTTAHWIAYTGAFAADGNILVAASRTLPGAAGRLEFYKLGRELDSTVYWQRSIAHAGYTTIRAGYGAPDGRSYWSGEGGRLIALDPGGAVLYDLPLKEPGRYNGYRLLARADDLYVIGDRLDGDNPADSLDKRLFIGKYDRSTGEADWTWEWTGDGIMSGPGASQAYFVDDSTLMMIVSTPTEGQWLTKFRLTGTSGLPTTDLPDGELKVVPNPAFDGRVTVPYPGQPGRLNVYDAVGRVVYRVGQETDVSIGLPARGVYRVVWSDGRRRRTATVVRP
jgi:hypothetical protein